MVTEIKIPDPTKQHEKTPVYVDKTVTVKDEKGKDIVTTQKVMLTTGTGMDTKVVKYGELAKHLDDAKLESKEELSPGVSVSAVEAVFDKEKPEKHGVWGLGCPKACGRFWEFKPNDDLTGFVPVDDVAWVPKSPKVIETAEIDVTPQVPILDKEGKPVLDKDGLPTYEIPDKKVFKTIYLIEDERRELIWVDSVPISRGYLNWLPNKNTVTFVCDRCGEEIHLIPAA